MIDKVQKIRNEVERLQNELIQEREKGYCSDTDDACILELQNVLTYIDSLQEEPVSEGLEEAVNAYIGYAPEVDESSSTYGKRQAFKAGANWQKAKDESTTEDLGEYISELSKQFPEVSFAKLSRIAVRVANWQKQQDQSTIELAEDHAMLAGMEKMKEEMMAKAIDGEVLENHDGKVVEYNETILDEKLSNCKVFDKVKVIVIKED